MQKQRNEERLLTLVAITPTAEPLEYCCDSIRLPLSADGQGRGEGSCGIRCGHAPAVLALGSGVLECLRNGKLLLRRYCAGGFAQVENNLVTVVTERLTELPSGEAPSDEP